MDQHYWQNMSACRYSYHPETDPFDITSYETSLLVNIIIGELIIGILSLVLMVTTIFFGSIIWACSSLPNDGRSKRAFDTLGHLVTVEWQDTMTSIASVLHPTASLKS